MYNFCVNTDPPILSFGSSPSPPIVSIGSILVLHCTAHGCPFPKVQLYKNDVLIDEQSPVVVSTVSDYTAKYTCIASNTIGNITHTVRKCITVIVQGSSRVVYVYIFMS